MRYFVKIVLKLVMTHKRAALIRLSQGARQREVRYSISKPGILSVFVSHFLTTTTNFNEILRSIFYL